MNISRLSQQRINNFDNSFAKQSPKNNEGVSFTSFVPTKEVTKSNFFKPVKKALKPITDLHQKGMDKLTDRMAKGFVKLFETKFVEKVVKGTKTDKLVTHLAVTTSAVLTTFYIKQTLKNEKLDPQKRTTLAINQGVVSVFSAIMGYAVEGLLNERVNKFIENFKNHNAGNPHLNDYVAGIKSAKSIIIIGVMYRFIAPVFMTPIANAIGNKVHENKEAKLAQGQALKKDA